jgi:excisionase family DNA binding protein
MLIPAENLSAVSDGNLSIQEATEFSRLSRAELYRLMTAGELTFLKHGKRRLIPRRSLVELLAKKVVPGTQN